MSLRELDNYLKKNLTIDERKKVIQYVIQRKYLIENGILSPSQLIEQKIKCQRLFKKGDDRYD